MGYSLPNKSLVAHWEVSLCPHTHHMVAPLAGDANDVGCLCHPTKHFARIVATITRLRKALLGHLNHRCSHPPLLNGTQGRVLTRPLLLHHPNGMQEPALTETDRY